MYKTVGLVFVAALVLMVPTLATANQLDLFGFNSRATGLANAYAALAEGPEAAFYNPAALIESKRLQTLVGYSFSVPALSLDRQLRQGGDASDPDQVREARDPAAGQFVNAGVSGGIYDRVFFALAMQVPVDGRARNKIFSPDRPYFLNYDAGIFGFTFLPAIGVQLAPNYGLGVGARITMDALGSFATDIPIADGEFQTQTLADSQYTATAAPIIGFYARALEFLRFGLVFYGESHCYYHKTVQQKLDPSNADSVVEIEYEAVYDYIPRKLSFAVAGEPDEHVLLTAGLDWVNWSAYVPPFPKIRLDFSRLYDAGLDYTRPTVLEREEPELNDIFIPRFGIEIRPYKFLALQIGYALQPAATPDQQGTTTILDSTTHVMSFGLGGNFGGPRGDLVSINFALMDHYLTDRWVAKADRQMQELDPETNPAYPRFEFHGHYLYSALTASFRF